MITIEQMQAAYKTCAPDFEVVKVTEALSKLVRTQEIWMALEHDSTFEDFCEAIDNALLVETTSSGLLDNVIDAMKISVKTLEALKEDL